MGLNINTPDTKNYEAWKAFIHTLKQFFALNARDQLIYLCSLGHLAPSTHNTQPWRFSVDTQTSTIGVFVEKKYILPASDFAGRQAIISVGAAIENMVVGAAHFGLIARVDCLNPDKKQLVSMGKGFGKSELIPLATIKFSKSDKAQCGNDIFRSIFNRRVSRVEFNPEKKLSAKIVNEMRGAVYGKEAALMCVTDKIRRLGLAEFQGQADGYVFNSPVFSKELGEWLLPNDTTSYLGMPGATFGLKSDQASRIHLGLTGRGALEPEDGLRFALGGKIGIEKSPFIGIITIFKDDVYHWLMAGQTFERIFLLLNARGVSVAVHAAIVEVALVNRIFAATSGTLRKIAVLFRAGYPIRKEDEAMPHSPRLPLGDVLI